VIRAWGGQVFALSYGFSDLSFGKGGPLDRWAYGDLIEEVKINLSVCG